MIKKSRKENPLIPGPVPWDRVLGFSMSVERGLTTRGGTYSLLLTGNGMLLGSHLYRSPMGAPLSPEAQPSPCPNPFFHQTNEVWARLPIPSDRLAVSCRGSCSCQKN